METKENEPNFELNFDYPIWQASSNKQNSLLDTFKNQTLNLEKQQLIQTIQKANLGLSSVLNQVGKISGYGYPILTFAYPSLSNTILYLQNLQKVKKIPGSLYLDDKFSDWYTIILQDMHDALNNKPTH